MPASPTHTRGDAVFMPFEGDSMLASILSKAHALADDSHISDRAVSAQIHSNR
jgi:hypothetical protein